MSVGTLLGAQSAPAAAGAFDPLSLGPAAWWKQDTLSALSDGDPVGTWVDSSGNGRDLTQATAGKKPTYKTAIVNGLAVVRFDGVDDAMHTAAFTLNQPLHYFLAVKLVTDPGGTDCYFDGNTADSVLLYNAATIGTVRMYAGSAGPTKTSVTWTNFRVLSAKYNGASSELSIDGDTAATGNTGAQNAGGVTLGARQTDSAGANADIAEVLVYPSALSTPDKDAVETYLGTKYAITVA